MTKIVFDFIDIDEDDAQEIQKDIAKKLAGAERKATSERTKAALAHQKATGTGRYSKKAGA